MLTPEENATRLNLYHQGLIDREIAEKTGRRARTITNWRHKHYLPANGGGCGRGKGEKRSHEGVPMERALTPKQCEEMRLFLGLLVKYADIAQGREKQIDVMQFVRAYRELSELPETRVEYAVG